MEILLPSICQARAAAVRLNAVEIEYRESDRENWFCRPRSTMAGFRHKSMLYNYATDDRLILGIKIFDFTDGPWALDTSLGFLSALVGRESK
jgi:hypothetical protein